MYIPHLTIGKIELLNNREKERVSKLVNQILKSNVLMDIPIKSIAYHLLGEGGSCKKILYQRTIS